MQPFIAIVEQDVSVCRALKRLVHSAGMEADTFATGEEFMDLIEGTPWFRVGCVVLGVQNALKIQERLTRGGYMTPVVFIETDDARSAREGAGRWRASLSYKPFEPELFIKTLHEALRRTVFAHRIPTCLEYFPSDVGCLDGLRRSK